MKNIVIICCSAGGKHGLGHLARCLKLAESIKCYNFQIIFALDGDLTLSTRVLSEGFEVFTNSFLEESFFKHVLDTEKQPCLVIFDTKMFINEVIADLTKKIPVACFEDEVIGFNRAQIVINNNIWVKKTDYAERTEGKCFIGAEFNTVDPKFFARAKERDGLIITMGGEDAPNYTLYLIKTLKTQISDIKTNIIVGPSHPNSNSIISFCKSELKNATVHVSPKNIVPFANQSHIAISAGGTTCYELLAAGVNIAVFPIEEHQFRLADAIVKKDAAFMLGSYVDFEGQKIQENFYNFLQLSRKNKFSKVGKKIFEGSGVNKLAFELVNYLKEEQEKNEQ